MPREEAVAREAIAATEKVAGVRLQVAITPEVAVAGPLSTSILAEIGADLDRGRTWFLFCVKLGWKDGGPYVLRR